MTCERLFCFMKLQNTNDSELKSILEQIINNYHPEKIILFGSATTESAIKPNDFDLLVIKNTKMPRLRRRAEALKNDESIC